MVLDHLLEREPHVDTAEQLLGLVDTGTLEGVICSTAARDYLRELLAIFDVACVDREALRGALDLGFPDFEDAVLHEAARSAGAAAIVTRNGKDFARSVIPVFSPTELLAAMYADPK